ncbi:MAG: Rrf2 family transcriptional regulator [Phycisphaerae bacterium]|nr:Rrf2 family transcriptional regulator [Phycisphaerae bacterium]
MLKVSEAASLGLHTAAVLAADPDRTLTTSEIAGGLNVSENHLSKVLQRMVKTGLIRSTRGPRGGFRLNRAPEEISLREIYEAIDGPMRQAACLFSRPVCDGNCILGDLLTSVNRQVRDYFSQTKLSAIGPIAGATHA